MRKSEENPCEERGGDCGICFRDAWTPGSIYRPGEAVPYGGSSYVAIHWNQNDPPPSPNWATIASKGDAGPGGPAGPQGPQGPAGASGASDVYTTATNQAPGLSPDGVDLASIAVPAGAYVLIATAGLTDFDNDDQNWTLNLRSGETVIATSTGRAHGDGNDVAVGESWGDNGTVLATYTAAGNTTITLTGFGYKISTGQVTLVAMKVGTIHAS
jgi:hypothetical protein